MTITELYKQNYIPGFDCRMATFRNNLAYYGHVFSNSMMLGLSGCLSFIYSKPVGNRIPFYTILGITDQSLEGLSSVFDSYFLYGECAFEKSKVLAFIKTNLDKNILINAAINRPLLNHVRKGKKVKDFVLDSAYTGFHFVTITGLKEDKITFFETDYSKPLEYDVDTFINMWFYDTIHNNVGLLDSGQACKGKYYTIHPPKFEPHKNKNALMFTIEKITNNFFTEGKYYHNGLKAIHDFFEDIKTWRYNVDKNCAISSIFYMKILEMNLSGGGFGRRLYSTFLAEVADIVNDDKLRIIAREFKETSKLWANFINSISSPETINSLKHNEFDLLESLAEAHSTNIIMTETDQFTHLRDWIKLNSEL